MPNGTPKPLAAAVFLAYKPMHTPRMIEITDPAARLNKNCMTLASSLPLRNCYFCFVKRWIFVNMYLQSASPPFKIYYTDYSRKIQYALPKLPIIGVKLHEKNIMFCREEFMIKLGYEARLYFVSLDSHHRNKNSCYKRIEEKLKFGEKDVVLWRN